LYAKEQHTMKFNVVIRSCKADLALLLQEGEPVFVDVTFVFF
jgi:hypothetical protein